MRKKEQQAYKTLLISLAIIGIFLICLILAQVPKVAWNLNKQDDAMAGAQEPYEATIDPNATDEPDEPLEDDNETGTPTPTLTPLPTAFATLTPQPTFTPFPSFTTEVFETPTPAPTFTVDVPGETTPTTSPTPKPAAQGQSNIGLIIGGVVGTILLVIGIVWIILSRQKKNNEYTMPAPPSNPAYPPYQPDPMNGGESTSSEWTPPADQQGYTTPYDQYMGNGNDPNQQPK